MSFYHDKQIKIYECFLAAFWLFNCRSMAVVLSISDKRSESDVPLA